jgi:hypothetical protein
VAWTTSTAIAAAMNAMMHTPETEMPLCLPGEGATVGLPWAGAITLPPKTWIPQPVAPHTAVLQLLMGI